MTKSEAVKQLAEFIEKEERMKIANKLSADAARKRKLTIDAIFNEVCSLDIDAEECE